VVNPERNGVISCSCVFPPSKNLVAYAQAAERLGYRRIWLYDSPALYGDVWIALARIATATERIGLGVGVAVASLRHPMVTASAIATIEELAPDRLVTVLGTDTPAANQWVSGQCGGRTYQPTSTRYAAYC